MIGQKGIGKTKFLEFLLNYMFGVQINDNYRYTLPESILDTSYKQNEVNNVSCYQFKSTTKGCPNLRVIDTPGFGGTDDI